MILPWVSVITTSHGKDGKLDIDTEPVDNTGFGLTKGKKLSAESSSSIPETEIVRETRSDSQAMGSGSTCQL